MIPLFLVKVIAMAMAVILAISFFAYANRLKKTYTNNLKTFDANTEAKVSRQWKKEVLLDNGEVSTTWYVDYSYTVENKEYVKCSDVGHYKKMFVDGATVDMFYKKDDPERFYVPAENSGDKTAYKILYVLGIIAVALAGSLFILLNSVLK